MILLLNSFLKIDPKKTRKFFYLVFLNLIQHQYYLQCPSNYQILRKVG